MLLWPCLGRMPRLTLPSYSGRCFIYFFVVLGTEQSHSATELHPQPFLVLVFEMGSPSVAEVGLKPAILPQPPKMLGLKIGIIVPGLGRCFGMETPTTFMWEL